MSKIIISKKQLQVLLETAMDLDIFSQLSHFDTDNGNKDIKKTTEDLIHKLQEINNMFDSNTNIKSETKMKYYELISKFDNIFDEIKFDN